MVFPAVISSDSLNHFLIAGSYLSLFLVLMGCGVGLPVPEDIPLILAGALAATGHMHLGWVGVAAWAGILTGDLILLHIARRYGQNVSRLPVIGKHVTPERLARVTGLFEKYGLWVVAIGRLVAGVRMAVVVTAGTVRYHRGRFILADGLAAMVSGGLFIALGYLLGANLPHLLERVENAKVYIISVGLLMVVGVGVWMFLHSRRRAHRAAGKAP